MQDLDQNVVELVIERGREKNQFADDAIGGAKFRVAILTALI